MIQRLCIFLCLCSLPATASEMVPEEPIRTRQVAIQSEVNMDSGLIEVAVCTGFGKTHESLIKTDTKPSELHAALLAIGLTSGSPAGYQGDTSLPTGDPVEVWVQWTAGDSVVEVRLEDLIYDAHLEAAMPQTAWVFSGSGFEDSQYVADLTGNIVTTFRDPYTVIDNPNPSGADDTVYYVNYGRCPPKGTPVKVIFRPVAVNSDK